MKEKTEPPPCTDQPLRSPADIAATPLPCPPTPLPHPCCPQCPVPSAAAPSLPLPLSCPADRPWLCHQGHMEALSGTTTFPSVVHASSSGAALCVNDINGTAVRCAAVGGNTSEATEGSTDSRSRHLGHLHQHSQPRQHPPPTPETGPDVNIGSVQEVFDVMPGKHARPSASICMP